MQWDRTDFYELLARKERILPGRKLGQRMAMQVGAFWVSQPGSIVQASLLAQVISILYPLTVLLQAGSDSDEASGDEPSTRPQQREPRHNAVREHYLRLSVSFYADKAPHSSPGSDH